MLIKLRTECFHAVRPTGSADVSISPVVAIQKFRKSCPLVGLLPNQ